jgi:hypothetical protein
MTGGQLNANGSSPRGLSTLELSWQIAGSEYLDFIIDGLSLLEALGDPDLVGCLGKGRNPIYEVGLVEQLLLWKPRELETGRCLLYVCPLCGDVGCGAITAEVEQEGDFYVWSQFGREVNYQYDDEPLFNVVGYEAIGPFRFDKIQYRDALTSWPLRREWP